MFSFHGRLGAVAGGGAPSGHGMGWFPERWPLGAVCRWASCMPFAPSLFLDFSARGFQPGVFPGGCCRVHFPSGGGWVWVLGGVGVGLDVVLHLAGL